MFAAPPGSLPRRRSAHHPLRVTADGAFPWCRAIGARRWPGLKPVACTPSPTSGAAAIRRGRDGPARGKPSRTLRRLPAAADYLQDNRHCSPATLGIEGGNNGGILVGAGITQAPARFSCRVHRPGAGHGALRSDARRPDLLRRARQSEYRRGLRIPYADSPYHHVVAGTEYPAVLFTVFESDARAAPTARPQNVRRPTAGNHVKERNRYRREARVGHAARSLSRGIELSVDTIAFHAHQLGLTFTAAP